MVVDRSFLEYSNVAKCLVVPVLREKKGVHRGNWVREPVADSRVQDKTAWYRWEYITQIMIEDAVIRDWEKSGWRRSCRGTGRLLIAQTSSCVALALPGMIASPASCVHTIPGTFLQLPRRCPFTSNVAFLMDQQLFFFVPRALNTNWFLYVQRI